MTNTIETEFRNFALAALKASSTMLDSLAPDAQQGIEIALHGGAHLELDFGPLPAFRTLSLVLVEAEGQRHVVCTAAVAQPLLS